ncbi:MAG: phosphoribosyltransferase [Candidatus Abyssubacteria bacterium]
MFRDRHDAARQLAHTLKHYKDRKPLILAVPRGGVVTGSILARELDGEFDVALTRKLRAPGNPELAMGSVDEDGNVYLNEEIARILGVSDRMIEEERQRQVEVIRGRAESYRRIYPKIPLEDRIVIVTDDGIATGATMRAAIQSAKAGKPRKLIAAIPVGPPEQIAELEADVDEMVCLMRPRNFAAVGQFYERFDQVEDSDVERILREFARSRV